MNIVRKCKCQLIRKIDAMTLRILCNDSLKSRGVREDFVLLNLCFYLMTPEISGKVVSLWQNFLD